MATETKAKKVSARPAKPEARPVIVCTEYKGVFYGVSDDTSGDVIKLKGARMVLYWGGTRGVMRLAESGPESGDKISAKADIEVRKITSVFELSSKAKAAWGALS